MFGYQINTLTRVSSNKSNATSSVSSGIQTPRSAGLKKTRCGQVFLRAVCVSNETPSGMFNIASQMNHDS